MINELIEQIGGRERLEFIAGNAISRERSMMASALLAVLDAKPIAYMHHSGQVVTREECCDDKVFSICCKVETPLYTTPPADSAPDGWLLIPAIPSQSHLNSIAMRYRHDFYLLPDNQRDIALSTARQMYEECSGQGFYSIPKPAAPAPGGE